MIFKDITATIDSASVETEISLKLMLKSDSKPISTDR